ncbi:Thymidylate kinase [Polystyrenella longa]|uniref:Thymidylate kinase n=1 Tax=Polystyrenella longa TaxID=2528007 RepID=A0A518CJP8_9PLAN|nr:dTMP kinase [Polystyrenella longa]QDU79456.1 Thymidylate kinase [Polystyrenella longa]
MLIAIEGIDGSGKGTQAKLLLESFRQTGRSAELISFPQYDATLFGRAIGDFLNGRFGALDEVNPFLVSLLYAGDRFESKKKLEGALAQCEFVILDRYVASNIAHQGSKVPVEERAELISWIKQIEFEIYQLPKPDLVVHLDLPVAAAQELISRKSKRTYTDKAADLQEADANYLSGVRDVYCELAVSERNWSQINCYNETTESIRSLEEIHRELLGLFSGKSN